MESYLADGTYQAQKYGERRESSQGRERCVAGQVCEERAGLLEENSRHSFARLSIGSPGPAFADEPADKCGGREPIEAGGGAVKPPAKAIDLESLPERRILSGADLVDRVADASRPRRGDESLPAPAAIRRAADAARKARIHFGPLHAVDV